MTTPTPELFRTVMGRFATGVTVMTTRQGAMPHGMTANAVTSVSLDPLLVLVCVERTTAMAGMVAATGHFALSILGADHEDRSNLFADPARPSGIDGFRGIPTRNAVTGSPVFEDALAWLDCRVWARHDGGDHEIVVGEVVACDLGGATEALGYYGSAYTSIALPDA